MGKNAQTNLPWSEIPVLLSLTRSGSLSAAALQLGVDRTTVARRLEKLEAKLEQRLFERQDGKMLPTPYGQRMFSRAELAEQELSDFGSNSADKRYEYGKVRISMSEQVLTGFSPQLAQFIADHQEVFLEITTTNSFADLSKYEADVVLRISRSPTQSLKMMDLGPVLFGLYQRKGSTRSHQNIMTHPRDEELLNKLSSIHPDAKLAAAIDGVLATREMILSSGGAGVLPRFLADADERLELLLNDLMPPKYRLFMGCLPEQRNLRRIQVVMRHLSQSLSNALGR